MKAKSTTRAKIVTALSALTTLAAGCGGSAVGAASHATLTFEVAIAFTGPDAPFGPETMAGCCQR